MRRGRGGGVQTPRAQTLAPTNPQGNPLTGPENHHNPNQPPNHTNHIAGTPKVWDPRKGSCGVQGPSRDPMGQDGHRENM